MTKFRNREGIQAVNAENRTFEALQGNYVEKGVEVSTDGTDMTLDITTGTVVQGNEEHDIGATTVTVPDNNEDGPRKDIVYVDGTQSVEVATGASENPEPALEDVDSVFNTAQPSPPSLVNQDDVVVLAEVWVEDGATEIEADEIRDRRIFLGLETGSETGQTEEVDNGESGSEATIDWTEGRLQKITLTDDATFDFVDPDFVGRYDIRITQGNDGGHDLTFPDNIIFVENEPEWSQGEEDDEIVISFRYDDDGKYVSTDTGFYEVDGE